MKRTAFDQLLDDIAKNVQVTTLKAGVYQLLVEKDATRYVLDAMSVENYGGHSMGHTNRGFLIINRLERHCFVFGQEMSPGPGYIGEKLFPRDFHWKTDIRNVWALVKYALTHLKWENPLAGPTEV